MLGGRGGSGKSWFKMDPEKNPGGGLYDPNKFVILDADEIKQEIPEYDGWNANQVHEESSDILEQALEFCLKKGLNVVLDQTMKTASKAIAKMVEFNQNGYRTEAHYMHLPVQEAAKRAIYRFKNSKKGPYQGRYVPVGAVLRNTTNEESFDQVRQYADAWSFRDNNVPQGTQPILISEGKNGRKLQKSLVKSFESAYNKDGRQADMEKNLKENKPYDYLDPEHWEYDGGTGKIGEIKSPYIKKKMDELAAQVFGNKKKQTIKA
jgi:predicted kinase